MGMSALSTALLQGGVRSKIEVPCRPQGCGSKTAGSFKNGTGTFRSDAAVVTWEGSRPPISRSHQVRHPQRKERREHSKL